MPCGNGTFWSATSRNPSRHVTDAVKNATGALVRAVTAVLSLKGSVIGGDISTLTVTARLVVTTTMKQIVQRTAVSGMNNARRCSKPPAADTVISLACVL